MTAIWDSTSAAKVHSNASGIFNNESRLNIGDVENSIKIYSDNLSVDHDRPNNLLKNIKEPIKSILRESIRCGNASRASKLQDLTMNSKTNENVTIPLKYSKPRIKNLH